MNKIQLLDFIILILIMAFIGTLNLNNITTLQSLGLLSGMGWIILLIFRLIKQGKNSGQKTIAKRTARKKR